MTTNLKTISWFIVIALFAVCTSCNKSSNEYDASGTFEATEILVSSESMGKIIQFDIVEGQQLTENQIVGTIDSVQLYLKKMQLLASQKAMLTRRPNLNKQIGAIEQQITTAKSEKKRIQNLVSANAANQKQLDDVNAQISVLEKQLVAQKSIIESTNDGISGENEALKIQVSQLNDQLKKCNIQSPINGTVLAKFTEKGELASPGRALFKIADMSQMMLRVYVTGDQVTKLKIGSQATVFADYGESNKEYKGKITWIASKSEFTPKTIQTRDERANLVYAIKINVTNDGLLKIGQYGSVKF